MQRRKGMQPSETEDEGIKQQKRMKMMTDMIRRIKAKGRIDANMLAQKKAWLHHEREDTLH